MTINEKFLNKLSSKLFSSPEECQAFEAALKDGNSAKPSEIKLPNNETYPLDNSSLLAVSVINQIKDKIENILDVCAAPGGKSVYSWLALKPDLLVANETISKRIPMLISNLKRCGITPCAVACLDSQMLALKYPEAFDLVLVDAPCSGQSLLAKGEKAPGALNPATINLNSNRQKRIIANSAKCVSPGGYLVYMTCTFSIEENEKVVSWFLKKFPSFVPQEASELSGYQSKFSDFPAYRLYPHLGLGAGAFSVICRNTNEGLSKGIEVENEKFVWKQSLL